MNTNNNQGEIDLGVAIAYMGGHQPFHPGSALAAKTMSLISFSASLKSLRASGRG